jgi:hypothetical protein
MAESDKIELRWRAPSLRISNIVRGRENVGPRVHYFIDADQASGEKAIPETVVLKRWRKRKLDGHQFFGTRLSPTVWRAVAFCFDMTAEGLCSLSKIEIEQACVLAHQKLKEGLLKLPSPDHLYHLLSALGPSRVERVISRHLSADRADRFGTPDLFLYSVSAAKGGVSFFRLVEVKRPRERISPDQQEELDFLISLGLPARVLRLSEQ